MTSFQEMTMDSSDAARGPGSRGQPVSEDLPVSPGPWRNCCGGVGGGEVTLGQDTVSIRIKFRLRTRPGLSAWERGLELDQRRSLGVDREGQATPEPRC